jgi:hypothetical protein
LLTKKYSEFWAFWKDITQKVDENTKEISKIQIKLENSIEPKIQALYVDRVK